MCVGMPSVAQEVKASLGQDGVIREALRREVINQRALARWLIDEHGWDTTEEAVLSAIRRYADALEGEVYDQAKTVLGQAHLNMRSQVGIVKMSKTQDVQEALPHLFELVDYTKGEALRVIQSERSIKVFVDEANIPAVLELLGERHVRETRRNVTEINLVLPMESKTTPGIAGLVLNTFGLHGINLLEIVTGIPEVLLFVHEEDALDAYEALDNLIGRVDARADGAEVPDTTPMAP